MAQKRPQVAELRSRFCRHAFLHSKDAMPAKVRYRCDARPGRHRWPRVGWDGPALLLRKQQQQVRRPIPTGGAGGKASLARGYPGGVKVGNWAFRRPRKITPCCSRWLTTWFIFMILFTGSGRVRRVQTSFNDRAIMEIEARKQA